MHIASKTPQQLVVKDGSRWISALCVFMACVGVYAAITQHQPKAFLGTGFGLLFAVIADRNITFTFDNMQRVVRWDGRKFLKTESGTIQFDEITDIGTEAFANGQGLPTYRLTLLTAQGSTPMAYAYSGVGNFEQMRKDILEFVKPGSYVAPAEPGILSDGIPEDLKSSLQSLLTQGRKIDAIALLRSREHIGLTEAVSRIDAFAEKMKTRD